MNEFQKEVGVARSGETKWVNTVVDFDRYGCSAVYITYYNHNGWCVAVNKGWFWYKLQPLVLTVSSSRVCKCNNQLKKYVSICFNMPVDKHMCVFTKHTTCVKRWYVRLSNDQITNI